LNILFTDLSTRRNIEQTPSKAGAGQKAGDKQKTVTKGKQVLGGGALRRKSLFVLKGAYGMGSC
jgi:hypothetical protein